MSKLLRLGDITLEIKNFNNDFLLLRTTEREKLGALGKAIFENNYDFVEEVIVTEVEICLKLKASFQEKKLETFDNLFLRESMEIRTFNLPVYFNDHGDWSIVKNTTGLEKSEIISKLTNSRFSVAMFGFLPGFLYLDGLDESLFVPRKKVPSKYVQANSIAIGGKYLGLYSLDSPGGWNVIGETPIKLLHIPELPPLQINLGDKLQLVSIDKQEFEQLIHQQVSLITYNA